jgi:hypothetical protein
LQGLIERFNAVVTACCRGCTAWSHMFCCCISSLDRMIVGVHMMLTGAEMAVWSLMTVHSTVQGRGSPARAHGAACSVPCPRAGIACAVCDVRCAALQTGRCRHTNVAELVACSACCLCNMACNIISVSVLRAHDDRLITMKVDGRCALPVLSLVSQALTT